MHQRYDDRLCRKYNRSRLCWWRYENSSDADVAHACVRRFIDGQNDAETLHPDGFSEESQTHPGVGLTDVEADVPIGHNEILSFFGTAIARRDARPRSDAQITCSLDEDGNVGVGAGRSIRCLIELKARCVFFVTQVHHYDVSDAHCGVNGHGRIHLLDQVVQNEGHDSIQVQLSAVCTCSIWAWLKWAKKVSSPS